MMKRLVAPIHAILLVVNLVAQPVGGAVPSLLARLNSTVLSLMDRLRIRNVARQARSFDAHLEQALGLLLTGRYSVF